MKRNIAGLILSGLMVVLLTACGENPGGISSGDSSQAPEPSPTNVVINEAPENPGEVLSYSLGTSFSLTLTLEFPDGTASRTARSDDEVEWSVDNEHVSITHAAEGTFSAESQGTTTITATVVDADGDEIKATVIVTVTNPATEIVIAEGTELTFSLGVQFTLTAKFILTDSTERQANSDEVEWSVDNEHVSITDAAMGAFSAESEGTTTITVTALDANGDEIQATVRVVIPETIVIDGVTYTAIKEEADFDLMRSYPAAKYALNNDIALTGDFEPIAPDTESQINFQGTPFTGIFEGNNKTISNLRIAKSGENYVGLFGQIGSATPEDSEANGVVRNLTLVLDAKNDPSVEGTSVVGALAGRSYGKIEAVGVEGGFVNGSDKVGGLVGYNGRAGSITSSYATSKVTGTGSDSVGGLVGQAYGNITSSYATGLVEGSNSVGGLVGWAPHRKNQITSSYATGKVSGANYVGGLVGSTSGKITSSYFDRSIENNSLGTGITPSTEIIAGGREPFAGVGWDFDGDDAVWVAQGNGQWPLLAWQLEQ